MTERPSFARNLGAHLLDKERDALGLLLKLTEIEITGRENLKSLEDKPAIFALFPHTSHLDSLLVRYILPPAIRHELVFLAKASYWSGIKKIVGELTNPLVLLPTDSDLIPLEAFRQSRDLLNSGHYIGIAPEGTRTAKPITERPFLPGIALLLSTTEYNFPIVPVILKGPLEVWPKGQRLPSPFVHTKHGLERKHISVRIGEPCYYQPIPRNQRMDIVEDLRQKCIALYHEI